MKHIIYSLIFISAAVLSSCSKERSSVTGWNYNDPKNGGFEKVPYEEQETGPGLVLIEGGRFTMGRVEQDVMYEWNNIPRTVTVSSFYLDETEISNFHYLEYLYWLERVYLADYPEIVKKALPDTLVWRDKLAFNEPYVEYYLRHPAYRDYPVVGVNWLQANDFCYWRTNRVNEFILVREGLFEWNPQQRNEDNFDTDAYFVGQYESGKAVQGIPSYNPDVEYRNVKMEDGILLPRYRLPTEAEWEYAARAGNTKLRPFPLIDMEQHAWYLHSSNDEVQPVATREANPWGLHDMYGNVWEWVNDWYHPDSYARSTEEKPQGPVDGDKKVRRGGSYHCPPHLIRSAYRSADLPTQAYSVLGFRLIATPR